MCKVINKEETKIALWILDKLNEQVKKGRENLIIEYVLNALGIKEEAEENPYGLTWSTGLKLQQGEANIDTSGMLHINTENVTDKRAVRAFEKEEIENIEMTIQEAVMQVEDLLNNLENEQETEIDANDIVALRKLLNSKKNNMKLSTFLNLKVSSVDELEYTLRKIEKLGMIDEGDYRFMTVGVDQTLK